MIQAYLRIRMDNRDDLRGAVFVIDTNDPADNYAWIPNRNNIPFRTSLSYLVDRRYYIRLKIRGIDE